MFPSRGSPPVPQPSRPSADTNQLSSHIQHILSAVLPEPVVSILAAISDALYRIFLGKPNDPPSYTSTLAPPAILLLVTYLATMLVYKSIRSFIGMLIFSLKWAVILGVIGFAVAWHLGNGDVQQGAHNMAQQSGISSSSWSNAVRQYPILRSPLIGIASGALPAAQEASNWLSQQMQAFQASGSSSSGQEQWQFETPDRQRSSSPGRVYRDLRPSSKESYTSQNDAVPYDVGSSTRQRLGKAERGPERVEKRSSREPNSDLFSKFSRWMGADLDAKQERQKRKNQ